MPSSPPCSEDLAYLAGIVDADGSISANRGLHSGRLYFGAVVSISGTRREPHDLAASFWGGAVNSYAGKEAHHRRCFQWNRQGRTAVPVLEALLPYLRIKHDQAILALAMQEHIELGRGPEPYPMLPPDYDPRPDLDVMAGEIRELNQWRRTA